MSHNELWTQYVNPFQGVHAEVSPPTLTDVESRIKLYSLIVYWLDARGHRLAIQRSILATTRNEAVLACELDRIVEEISDASEEAYDKRRSFAYELVLAESLAEDTRLQPPHDSTIVALAAPLVAAKKSTTTGDVYHDKTMLYCPHNRSKLNFFITTPA